MGTALIGSGVNAANLANNAFSQDHGCVGGGVGDTTEAHSARTQHIAGTYSNYGAFCGSGSTGKTVQWRKTGGNANGNLNFGSSAGASLYDNVSVDSYLTTDTRDFKVTIAAGGISFQWIKSVFTASSGHASVHSAAATFASTTTAFSPIGGRVDDLTNTAWTTTESFAQCRMRTAGNLQFVWISVTTASTSTATVISRVGGVNGNINISLTANGTGIFEDTSNSDSFTSGSLLNFQCSGQSAGLVMMNGISSWLNYTGTSNEVFAGFGVNTIGGAVAFLPLCCPAIAANIAEANCQLQHGFAGISSNMRVQSLVNSQSGTTVFRYRIGGANANQNFTVPASGTGWFEDSTNTDTFGPTDNVAIQYTPTGASGAVTWGAFITTEQPSATFQPVHLDFVPIQQLGSRINETYSSQGFIPNPPPPAPLAQNMEYVFQQNTVIKMQLDPLSFGVSRFFGTVTPKIWGAFQHQQDVPQLSKQQRDVLYVPFGAMVPTPGFLTTQEAPDTLASNLSIPPPIQLIINGWYIDSRGGLHYYYRNPDGSNGPLPPQ